VAGFHRDPLGELTALLQTHQLVFGVRKEDQKKRGKEGGREGKGKGGREEESEGERGLTMFRGGLAPALRTTHPGPGHNFGQFLLRDMEH